ncbi:MAG: hypothetical protein AAFX80_24600, partial [Cyanobacteria bacterium J06639_18]
MRTDFELYPDDWTDIATAIKREARWRCQKCGLQCIAPGEDTSKLTRSHSWRNAYGTLRPCAARLPRMKRMLQVHHWDRNPANNCRDNLIALCS